VHKGFESKQRKKAESSRPWLELEIELRARETFTLQPFLRSYKQSTALLFIVHLQQAVFSTNSYLFLNGGTENLV